MMATHLLATHDVAEALELLQALVKDIGAVAAVSPALADSIGQQALEVEWRHNNFEAVMQTCNRLVSYIPFAVVAEWSLDAIGHCGGEVRALAAFAQVFPEDVEKPKKHKECRFDDSDSD